LDAGYREAIGDQHHDSPLAAAVHAEWLIAIEEEEVSMVSTIKKNVPIRDVVETAVREVLYGHLDRGDEAFSTLPDKGVDELFYSPQVSELKAEIVGAGRRLWQREYVDGNGGNISARISDELVLCTPTLCSKGQLREQDLSIVDLENRQIFGVRQQTSEILLHLEIYKTVPCARAVIHCHPPYATAHAVAGVIPEGNLIPEQEVFVGPLALAPYETPGTKQFAETIQPFVRNHNTVLLANHGIVCWADSVTHAGWFVEVVETYCKTIMIASQLRNPLPQIPPAKILELLEIKKRLGLPDARLPAVDQEIDPSPLQNKNSKSSAFSSGGPRRGLKNGETLAAALTARILQDLGVRE
jgi:L-fuculose-phosphate aldolase